MLDDAIFLIDCCGSGGSALGAVLTTAALAERTEDCACAIGSSGGFVRKGLMEVVSRRAGVRTRGRRARPNERSHSGRLLEEEVAVNIQPPVAPASAPSQKPRIAPWPLPKPEEVYCNICGGRDFSSVGLTRPRDQLPALCRQCRSVERHRAIRLAYEALRPMLSTWRAFQFAPDGCIERSWFKSYVGSVFEAENSTDMMRTGLPAGSFDLVISNHVLEHVADDRQAVRELLRVVGPNGVVHYCVPSPMYRWRTSDWKFADPEKDMHYREYGSDFPQLLKEFAPKSHVVAVVAVDPATGVPDIVYFQSLELNVLESMGSLLRKLSFPVVEF